jgi:hypothetical protein
MSMAWLAHSEDHRHPIRAESPCHEGKRLRRLPVQPLTIVDDTDERSLLRGVGEQGQDGQADQEPIRSVSVSEAERGTQCVALRARQLGNPIQHRRAHLVQPRKREFHLGLDARCTRNVATLSLLDQVLEQGGLPDTCLAAQDEYLALTSPGIGNDATKRLALGAPAMQPLPRKGIRHRTAMLHT